MEAKTLVQLFEYAQKMHGHVTNFCEKDQFKKFQKTSLDHLHFEAENLAIGLLDLGIQPKTNIGLIADNSTQWALCDLAILMNGAVNVPRGTDSTSQEIEYILNHCEAKFVFFHNLKTLENMKPILANTKIQKCIIMDPAYQDVPGEENVFSVSTLITKGKELRSQLLPELKKRSTQIKSDDIFTIIYTSGTTGNPKGVMLSHSNMLYNVKVVPPMVGLQKNDRSLSILPVWHIFERAVDYAIVYSGASIYYTNIRDLRDDFKRVKPTFMASAPRLWENIYLGIKNKVESEGGIKKVLFDTGMALRKQFQANVDQLTGNRLMTEDVEPIENMVNSGSALLNSLALFVPAQIADNVIFAKIREALGGELRGTISGGGALPLHVDQFFNAIGIPIYEGYGMTECAPIIAVRRVGKVVQGSVGFAPEKTQIKILDDQGNQVPTGTIGVIHVKGPQVMKGYYKNDEATNQVLNEGWLNTGDLGFIGYNGTLSVRGRAKDTIVLSGGENIEPVPIENLLLEVDEIDQVIVVGQDMKTLGALIWPNYEKMREAGLIFKEGENLNNNMSVKAHFANLIKKNISSQNGFKSFERITGFQFLPKAMEVGDELTSLYKMKRNVIAAKYQQLLEQIYR